MSENIFRLENVGKSFSAAGGRLEILSGINLSLDKGESLSIMGRSGSGKSTLLSIAALIDRPTSGDIFYHGRNVSSLSESALTELRRSTMGFVFQNSLLLDDFSALENVALPLLNLKHGRKEAYERSREILTSVGMGERLGHRPDALSGGERQRVAIARALAVSPEVIFADEPTGALDEESAAMVENLLLAEVEQRGLSLVLVTHNPQFAARCSRRCILAHRELADA